MPAGRWRDSDANLIQAHGGQIQLMPVPDGEGNLSEKYVWVGENKTSVAGENGVAGHLGNPVSMYFSDDLYNWTCGGNVMLPVASMEQFDTDDYFIKLYSDYTAAQKRHVFDCINSNAVIERPKMLYNERTGKYVLWFHCDNSTDKNTYKYDVGMAGVAVANSPFGPFKFIDRYRLNECPAGQIDCFPYSKGEARDMNLFKDGDGTAYIVYTSENNKTLYISKLNEEYTYLSSNPEKAVYRKDFIRLFPGSMREAPVLISADNGKYYLFSSSTTGWMSNEARVWSANSIFGEWSNDGNPCVGAGASVTFDSQSTCLFRAPNGQWIYCGDRWNGSELYDSRYVWLPVTFVGDRLTVSWQSEWKWEDYNAF